MPIHIRTFLTISDVLFAETLTQKENWRSETSLELKTMFDYDPEGCFIAEIEGHPVGICVATAYKKSGFIGELIVIPEARQKGVGMRLMQSAVGYLRNKNIQQIFLDGVIKAVPLYENLGFQTITRSLRFFGQIQAQQSENVFPISQRELPEILKLDQEYFGDDRSFFLNRRITNYPQLCYFLRDKNEITAYLFARQGRGGWITIGPWVSILNPSASLPLLQHFQYQIGNQPFSMGILASNLAAIQLVVQNGLMPQPDPPHRMGARFIGNPGSSPQCCAIGSPAKG